MDKFIPWEQLEKKIARVIALRATTVGLPVRYAASLLHTNPSLIQ